MVHNGSPASADESNDSADEPTREEERGDVAEPDAPTATEENEGMSTVLGTETASGVQEDDEGRD